MVPSVIETFCPIRRTWDGRRSSGSPGPHLPSSIRRWVTIGGADREEDGMKLVRSRNTRRLVLALLLVCVAAMAGSSAHASHGWCGDSMVNLTPMGPSWNGVGVKTGGANGGIINVCWSFLGSDPTAPCGTGSTCNGFQVAQGSETGTIELRNGSTATPTVNRYGAAIHVAMPACLQDFAVYAGGTTPVIGPNDVGVCPTE